MGQLDGVDGLREGTDLVDLDQQGVCGVGLDALGQALRVGDEQVVADDLHLVADLLVEGGPGLPVLLVEGVLDGDQRVLGDELLVVLDHLGARLGRALEVVLAVGVELGGGDVQGQGDVLAGLVASSLDGLADEVEGGGIAGQVRGEAALVTQTGGQALVLEDLLECVVDGSAHAVGLTEGVRTDRGDHELLDVDVGVGVGSTVEDVHHGNGQDVGIRSTQVLVEGQLGRVGGGTGDGQGHAEDGVGAELALVVGSVELDHHRIDDALLGGVVSDDLFGQSLLDVLNSLENTLAAVAILVAVAKLNGLEVAGGGTGRNGGTGLGRVVENDLDLDGGVAARVEDLTCIDEFDGCHGPTFQRGSFVQSQTIGAVQGAQQHRRRT